MLMKNLFDRKYAKSNLQIMILGISSMTKFVASFNNSCMMASQHTNCLFSYVYLFGGRSVHMIGKPCGLPIGECVTR